MKLGDPEVVGQLMRERRKSMGFTIEQMAEAVGLAPITIIRIEKGRMGYIHAKTAKALEVPKKITKRMVMQSVAVMQSGDTEAMQPEALVPAPLPPLKLKAGKVMISKPKPTVRQRVFNWLSGEFGKLAKE